MVSENYGFRSPRAFSKTSSFSILFPLIVVLEGFSLLSHGSGPQMLQVMHLSNKRSSQGEFYEQAFSRAGNGGYIGTFTGLTYPLQK